MTLDTPFGHMQWGLDCGHTGCLLFAKGMVTRMGRKAACVQKCTQMEMAIVLLLQARKELESNIQGSYIPKINVG